MELWDIYDKDGNKTGRTHTRGVPMGPGEYHIATVVVVANSRREILCTLRSPEKPLFPGMWENTGGSVVAGEESLTAALRELREETGITAVPEELTFLYRNTGPDFFMDIYGLRRDMRAEDVIFQPGETCGAKWIPYGKWEKLGRAGEILTPAGPDNEEFFEILRNYIREGK